MAFEEISYEKMSVEEIEGLGIEDLESRLEMAAAGTGVDDISIGGGIRVTWGAK